MSLKPATIMPFLLIPALCFAGVRGIIVDGSTSLPLQGATASLLTNGNKTNSDALGYFNIDASAPVGTNAASRVDASQIQIHGNLLTYAIAEGNQAPVLISASNLTGHSLQIHNGISQSGSHSIDLSQHLKTSGFYILGITIGSKQITQAIVVNSPNNTSKLSAEDRNTSRSSALKRSTLFAAVTAMWDTLVITKTNYLTVKLGLNSAQDSVNKVILYPVSSTTTSSSSTTGAPAVLWQMKDYCSYDGVSETKNPGYISESPLNLNNAIGASYSFEMSLSQSSQVVLSVSFSNGGTVARPMNILVDGANVGSFAFALTGGWGVWVSESKTISVQAGSHTIKLVATTADGGPNVDYTGTSTANVSKGTCKITSLSSVAPLSSSTVPPLSSIGTPLSSAVNPSSSTVATSSTIIPIGYAMVNGTTTGGGNVAPTTVKTLAEFKAAAADKNPRVIIVEGTITATNTVPIASNKTIIGKDKNAKIYGGIEMNGVNNVIVRNLNIQGVWPNTGAGDAVAVKGGSHHIWLDHLAVWDAPDGNMDITQASNYVTVSWCKFWYTSASHTHRLNGLIGAGGGTQPNDWGKNKVTYHHNWFSDLVNQRMPRAMYGEIHVFNNYYTSKGNGNCVGFGSYASVLVENNYFKGVNNPIEFQYDLYAWVVNRGNTFDGTTGTGPKLDGKQGSRYETNPDQPFEVKALSTVPYTYPLTPVANIPALVSAGAGPQ